MSRRTPAAAGVKLNLSPATTTSGRFSTSPVCLFQTAGKLGPVEAARVPSPHHHAAQHPVVLAPEVEAESRRPGRSTTTGQKGEEDPASHGRS